MEPLEPVINATDLAEHVYQECWDEFQSWHSKQAVEKTRFNRTLLAMDLQEEEEFDETVYKRPNNKTVRELYTSSYSARYLDEDSLELEDDLVEPELERSKIWKILTKAETIPIYSSFSPVRQLNYIRGDLWINEKGEYIRLAPNPDDSVPKDEAALIRNVIREEGKKIQDGLIKNAEVDGDPSINQESMPFIPPEIPRHRLDDYIDKFHEPEAWRDARTYWDNDEDIIEGETIRRLLFIHGMNEEGIDRTEVLPRNVREVYLALRHRTYPDLDVIYPKDPPLPPLPTDDWLQLPSVGSSLEDRVREQIFYICHRIDCQGVMCRAHYPARQRAIQANPVRGPGPQTPRWTEPTRTALELNAKFKRDRRTPCGQGCFVIAEPVPDPSNFSDDIVGLGDESDLSPRVIDDIKTIWKAEADAMPCDVAGLGLDRFTCRQAYHVRCEMYPNLAEPESGSDDSSGADRRKFKGRGKGKAVSLRNVITLGHAETTRLAHASYRKPTVCETASVTLLGAVALNPPAQTFAAQPNADASKTVWNAIPICVEDAVLDGYPCTNVPLLMRNWKATQVKPSEFGNGLFLATGTAAVKDDLIADYTGDIIQERTALRRNALADSNGRNYIFNFAEPVPSLDAGFIGNESRFANHPMNGNANCGARYVCVGGEQRIGIYATKHIYQGDELLLDYGEKFFIKEPPKYNQRHGDSEVETGDENEEELEVGSGDDDDEEEYSEEEGSSESL